MSIVMALRFTALVLIGCVKSSLGQSNTSLRGNSSEGRDGSVICEDSKQRPCRQVCANHEKRYLTLQDGDKTLLEFPRKHGDGYVSAANQNCTWQWNLNPGADRGEVNGNLTVSLGNGTKLIVRYDDKVQEMTNGNGTMKTYTIAAPLPMSITFVSGKEGGTGYFTFVSDVDLWMPPDKKILMLAEVVQAIPWILALVMLILMIVFRRRVRRWFSDASRMPMLRRLIPRAALDEAEMDQLCPKEEYIADPGHEKECPVCLGVLENHTFIRRMRCPAAHAIHSECAEGWLVRKGTCPVCRFDHLPLLPERAPTEVRVSLQELAQQIRDGEVNDHDLTEYSALRDTD